jgi:hypothetical protein
MVPGKLFSLGRFYGSLRLSKGKTPKKESEVLSLHRCFDRVFKYPQNFDTTEGFSTCSFGVMKCFSTYSSEIDWFSTYVSMPVSVTLVRGEEHEARRKERILYF